MKRTDLTHSERMTQLGACVRAKLAACRAMVAASQEHNVEAYKVAYAAHTEAAREAATLRYG